jgi:hypothetical protein
MRNLIFTVVLVLANLLSAQETKSLGDFSKVTAFDKISVKLVASSENKIELSGNLSEEVQVVTSNDELKIKMPFDKLMKGGDVLATVYFKKLEGIEVNEGSTILCDTQIKATDFSLIAKEGGQIEVNIDSERIKVKSTNGSQITLEGKTKNLDILINSGGQIDAKNCIANQTIVSVNAGGNANVTGVDLVDAKIRAGGNITIFGNPKQINQKTVLGGNISINKR